MGMGGRRAGATGRPAAGGAAMLRGMGPAGAIPIAAAVPTASASPAGPGAMSAGPVAGATRIFAPRATPSRATAPSAPTVCGVPPAVARALLPALAGPRWPSIGLRLG